MSNPYTWLDNVGTLPRTISEGRKLLGVTETPGPKNNPVILAWADEVSEKVGAQYNQDLTPWCGLFVAVVCKRAGKEPVKDPLWARNWAKFGSHADYASLGDVLVFSRGGAGHVGFYVGEDATAYHVLQGNTTDKVVIGRIAKERCIAVCRPPYRNKPASVKPYHLVRGSGALSTNEA